MSAISWEQKLNSIFTKPFLWIKKTYDFYRLPPAVRSIFSECDGKNLNLSETLKGFNSQKIKATFEYISTYFPQLETLSLAYNDLLTLPESLGRLPQLNELYLSNNQLSFLPDTIGKLTQLTKLHLDHNPLKKLPKSLIESQAIFSILPNSIKTLLLNCDGKTLDLRDELKKLDFFTIKALLEHAAIEFPHLEKLTLSDNKLTILPKVIGNFTHLKSLILDDNQLTTLPDSIGNLTQLEKLSVAANQLTALPDTIGNLTQLNMLYLAANQLTILPDSIGQLTQLTQMSVFNNKLSSLPEVMGNLTQLKELDASRNQLISLPKSFSNLTQLEVLYFSHNCLTTLPEFIGKLTKLDCLILNRNPFLAHPIKISDHDEFASHSIKQFSTLLSYSLVSKQCYKAVKSRSFIQPEPLNTSSNTDHTQLTSLTNLPKGLLKKIILEASNLTSRQYLLLNNFMDKELTSKSTLSSLEKVSPNWKNVVEMNGETVGRSR